MDPGRALVPAVAVLLLIAPATVPAQERRVQEIGLPEDVAAGIVDFLNHPGTIRFHGPSTLPSGGTLEGNVGVLGGPFRVAGSIDGDVVVVNGDLQFLPGARVTGDVLVVGGAVFTPDDASIGGTLVEYEEGLRYTERGGRVQIRPELAREGGFLRLGRGVRVTVRTAGAYNRVEGLPVLFGPQVTTSGPHPLRVEALGLWRTESGLALDSDELGYLLRAEQRFGSVPRAALGATLHSRIDPISGWGITGLESSLSTFFLHKDYRDHFEREGWSAFLRLDSPRFPLALTVEFRDEEHAFAPVSSPWTLRSNDEPWRPQPLVAEGALQTLSSELVLDDRNDPDEPTDGWYARARLVRGLDGDLNLPEYVDPVDETVVPPAPVDHRFTAGLFDFRRHTRVSPDSDLGIRVLYAGALDGDPLPSQFQQALGGEGSLPGYRLFSIDCGARDRRIEIPRHGLDEDDDPAQPAFPRFGCDRALLFQAEFRGSFAFDLDPAPQGEDEWTADWDWYPLVDLTPSWAVFIDAGRGWSEAAGVPDTDTFADLGLGLVLGDLGLYWAYPLTGEDRGLNFFVRLSRRF